MRQTPRYEASFFSGHLNGSARSAAVVVPLLLKHFPARSVIDVGCGVGTWLAEFARHGISDYLGVDGDYVPRDLLVMPSDHFQAADLSTFSPPARRFDLACSLEVAEHLPPACAASFVRLLTHLSPVVLFSAAIPGQGGTNHLNEQWQSYWAALFRVRGYVGIDCIRPAIFNDDRVELWYRQNTLIYCDPAKVPAGLRPLTTAYEFDRIDPELFRARDLEQKPQRSLRSLLRSLAR
jgi:SAM-dependent methyltransferase